MEGNFCRVGSYGGPKQRSGKKIPSLRDLSFLADAVAVSVGKKHSDTDDAADAER